MSYAIYEIENSLNWDLVTRQSLNGRRIEGEKTFLIDPVSAVLNSRLLLVGCRSVSARPSWRLGCWTNFRLLVSPSSTTEFISAVEFYTKSCQLNRLTLIEVPQIYPWPYLLYLEFPRWLGSIDVEIWKYSGLVEDSVEVRLDIIEGKIDSLNSSP